MNRHRHRFTEFEEHLGKGRRTESTFRIVGKTDQFLGNTDKVRIQYTISIGTILREPLNAFSAGGIAE